MIVGVGIDVVNIAEMEDILRSIPPAVKSIIFTREEIVRSGQEADPVEYLATRFAAKEAVTKAIAPRVEKGAFDYDMRIVETLNREDGSPYVSVSPELREVMEFAGVLSVHVSISTESGHAYALAVAEG